MPGNHEFYRGEYSRVLRDLRAAAAKTSNIHLLDKESATIGDVEFLGAILWTDFSLNGETPEEMRIAESFAATQLTDFTGTIRFEEHGNFRRFRPSDTALLHTEAKAWLASRLYEPSEKKRVVVTHHLPSAQSIAARFQNDQLSPAFASRLDSRVALADCGSTGIPTTTSIISSVSAWLSAIHMVTSYRGARQRMSRLIQD